MSAAAATAHSPNWASGAYGVRVLSPVPKLETEFDMLVHKVGLENQPDLWQYNLRLKAFAKAHRNNRYVPEFLLAAWGITVCVEKNL
jgi:hypothetical protein